MLRTLTKCDWVGRKRHSDDKNRFGVDRNGLALFGHIKP